MTSVAITLSDRLSDFPTHRDLHVDQAGEVVVRYVSPVAGGEVVPLRRAFGRVLKTEIYSAIPVPPFDHSAVDGYGVRSKDATAPEATLPVVARVLAGEAGYGDIGKAAVHVMTGAPIPAGCDAVVKQEHSLRRDGFVTITDTVRHGANIRRIGEDVAVGDSIIRSGAVLDTRHIALLAACGIPKVLVARRVRVAIAAFGRELRPPGGRLRRGQIYDANTEMAAAFLNRPCCRIVECARAGDDRDYAAARLRDLAADTDLIVTSGGMAQGDEDHTTSAVEQAGGSWRKVAFCMKPGKPARLGRLQNAVVLGLPGNPFAALVALLVLGLPVLGALSGGRGSPKWLPAQAGFELDRNTGRTEFFPAGIVGSGDAGPLTVERLGKGGSARLHPLVHADGLGRLEAGLSRVRPGSKLLFLPFSSMLS